jgi:S1-C subfamily serine protease
LAPAQAADRVENAKKFTVLVTNEGIFGAGRGSGILLDERHVLTCFHMMRSPKDEMLVYTYPMGAVYKAHVDAWDASNDIAFLVLDSSAVVRVKPVFRTTVRDGEPITVIGNALGSMKWLVAHGIVSGQERGDILTDAAVQHGDSGGPWINEQGEIIAMTDWGLEKTPGISGGISGAVLAQAVDRYQHPERAMAELLWRRYSGNR